MARQIITKSSPTPRGPRAAVSVDEYKDRLLKLIPSEVVTAYTTIYGLISGSAVASGDGQTQQGNKEMLLWIVFAVLIILTPIYLYKISKVTQLPQIIFTTLAFVIWVIAIGGPIDRILEFPAEFIGSIMLVLYTLIIPLIYK